VARIAGVATAGRHLRVAPSAWRSGHLGEGHRLEASFDEETQRHVGDQAAEEWLDLCTRCPWPEQQRYEVLRSVVLFGHSPAERALETGVPRTSLYRRVRRFKELGMVSLFTDVAADERPSRPSLPPDMRQFIVDLKAEHAPFRPNEIATICELKFGRRPSPHTVQRVLADGPPPSRATRRYPPYHQIADPADARHAVITLHDEGWNAKSIAAYLKTSRQTVHAILRRWVEDGRHAPAEVLGFVHGRVWTRVALDRAFRFRAGRTIDRHGYVRYANWRLYGERALVGQPAVVWRCGDSLLVEHQDIPLTHVAVDVVPNTRLIRAMKEARLFETPFVSPQPFLPDLGDVEWLLAVRMPCPLTAPFPARIG